MTMTTTATLTTCPSWCDGHEPGEPAAEHVVSNMMLRLPELRLGDRVLREGAGLPLDVALVQAADELGAEPFVELLFPERPRLTAGEARSLAAMLVRAAERIELG